MADIDETMEPGIPITEALAQLSRRKAEAVPREAADIVIAADTMVVCDGQQLGKPKDRADAGRMLALLSGRSHQVMTGLTVMQGEKCVCHTEVTEVFFRKLSAEEIRDYVSSGDCDDKAGAYGVQSGAAVFVEKICGDYYNVVGLPVCRLACILKEEFL